MMSNDAAWFYKAFWLVQDKIVFLEAIGDFTSEGIIEMNQYVRDEFLEKVPGKVHCIMDATGLSGYPNNLKTLRQATSISVRHPNMDWVVLIGFDSPLLRFIGGAVGQILGVKFRQVGSLDEARSLLSKVDLTLVATD